MSSCPVELDELSLLGAVVRRRFEAHPLYFWVGARGGAEYVRLRMAGDDGAFFLEGKLHELPCRAASAPDALTSGRQGRVLAPQVSRFNDLIDLPFSIFPLDHAFLHCRRGNGGGPYQLYSR